MIFIVSLFKVKRATSRIRTDKPAAYKAAALPIGATVALYLIEKVVGEGLCKDLKDLNLLRTSA